VLGLLFSLISSLPLANFNHGSPSIAGRLSWNFHTHQAKHLNVITIDHTIACIHDELAQIVHIWALATSGCQEECRLHLQFAGALSNDGAFQHTLLRHDLFDAGLQLFLDLLLAVVHVAICPAGTLHRDRFTNQSKADLTASFPIHGLVKCGINAVHF